MQWCGTATELLERVSRGVDQRAERAKAWPRSPKARGNQLRRLVPTLRTVGVEVEFEREPHTGRRLVSLRTVPHKNVTLVTGATDGQQAWGHRDSAGDVSGDVACPSPPTQRGPNVTPKTLAPAGPAATVTSLRGLVLQSGRRT